MSDVKKVSAIKTFNQWVDVCRKNLWIFFSVVLVIALIISFIPLGNISKTSAGDLMVSFLNEKTGGGVSLVSVTSFGSFYEVLVDYQGQTVPVYMTKDGKQFVQGIEEMEISEPITQFVTGEVIKSDKPEVELFIMTHCPYGTQAEKGFIPAIKALGNVVDAKVRFIYYFMHQPEETETPRQVCIREEQPTKFLPYLECFLEDGDSDRCITKTGVDKTAMEGCISNGNADKYYEIDSKLSQGYPADSSPTLVVNGAIVETGRSEAAMLNAICSTFNNAPESCNLELNSVSSSPGFGYQEGVETTATC